MLGWLMLGWLMLRALISSNIPLMRLLEILLPPEMLLLKMLLSLEIPSLLGTAALFRTVALFRTTAPLLISVLYRCLAPAALSIGTG